MIPAALFVFSLYEFDLFLYFGGDYFMIGLWGVE
jgi:hypothetical protein